MRRRVAVRHVRAHLLHAYGSDVSGLSLAMAAHYYDAIADLTDVSPQELHLRIVGWVRRAQPIAATRCMGCVPTILPGIEHDCGGSKIPTEE
ncbi:hypothetical protein O3597_17355 [Verrucosispora sp. WMMA2044]|uniref:hypothetical protein n=1 Tax=Verrucosispora sp. WMMA2044 TaxID=3016419 RepID=UPI00248AFEFA|nr:hypothetical protein [Verrucosispora sp. WMMA2044]WBB46937.1 hypothetical protein O3597_17355 [Verrucosispora sp. WMMA2044]